MPTKHQRAQRAKIFQPFDSLKGFKEILKTKEKIIVEKIELSEDQLADLDRTIHQIENGMMVQVIYYDQGEYIKKKV